MVKHVVLISGKRKSGKDFVSSILKELFLKNVSCSVVGVSHSLKKEYAMMHGLSYDELLTDGPFKEQHRENMIFWGEQKRNEDFGYFCRSALESASSSDIVIVSDCRRTSDMEFFVSAFDGYLTTVRIESSLEVRISRGFNFVAGVDDAESECGLDNYIFDYTIENQGDCLDLLVSKLAQVVDHVYSQF